MSLRAPWALPSLLTLLLFGCGDSSTAPTTPAPVDEPDLPRDEIELLVERFSRDGARSTYTMALDGSRVLPLVGLPSGAFGIAPSPDGRTLAFLVPTEEGDQHLWLADRDGTNPRPLIQGNWLVEHVAWSADGMRLAISGSTFTENDDIWVLDADGTGLVDLTPDPGSAVLLDRNPAWSPDGSSIVFESNRSGVTRLWIMDADGSDPRQVAVDSTYLEREPAWSPDGSSIVFAIPGLGLGLVNPDGSGYRVIGIGGRPADPAWTGDGRVVFSADGITRRDIFVMDPIGGAPVNLTRSSDDDVRARPLRYVAPAAWRGLAAAEWIDANRPAPVGLVSGDLIADGRNDVIVLDEAFESIRLYGGASTGTPSLVGTLDAAFALRDAGVADVSRDGDDDLIVLSSDALVVWRGGSAGPGIPTVHPLRGDARGLAVADFDRDGSVDVAGIHAADGNGFRMLLHSARSGDGVLIPILDFPSAFRHPGRAMAADVTGDGAADVIVVTADPTAPVVLLPGRGDISFLAEVVASTTLPADSTAVPLAADLDGDRRADLVWYRPSDAAGVAVARSLGDVFDSEQRLDLVATAVVAHDLDRDGDVDLVAVDGSSWSFVRNRGDGLLARPIVGTLGRRAVDLRVDDLDADGWPDLIVLADDGSLAVLRNRGR